jgi:hypothetical protein
VVVPLHEFPNMLTPPVTLPPRVGPFARDSERFVIRLLIGGIKKPR